MAGGLAVLNIPVIFSLRNYDNSALYSFTWPHQEEGGNGKLLPGVGGGGGGGSYYVKNPHHILLRMYDNSTV